MENVTTSKLRAGFITKLCGVADGTELCEINSREIVAEAIAFVILRLDLVVACFDQFGSIGDKVVESGNLDYHLVGV